MRTYLVLTVLFFSSCSIIKRNNFIESKGYNPQKDTAIIKPYEYYIKNKGYYPHYTELNTDKKLDSKISIQGFENSDTISFERIFKQMKFVLTDSSQIITYGELHFKRNGSSNIVKFGQQFPDSCTCKASFEFIKSRFRQKRKNDILFFWDVRVLKNNITYTLPSRVYYLK
ncbi:MAG: hypothetical protein IPO01_00010 [Chitinophagaceae bacterium]|nr:hypothetical protein [Chitinophagaceae bacterium]MBK9483659.1 hypothetical protein [Chitinophagaceae bacterium]